MKGLEAELGQCQRQRLRGCPGNSCANDLRPNKLRRLAKRLKRKDILNVASAKLLGKPGVRNNREPFKQGRAQQRWLEAALSYIKTSSWRRPLTIMQHVHGAFISSKF